MISNLTNLTDVVNGARQGDMRAELYREEKIQPLLREMLSRARRARETPLQFGLDSAEIVDAAVNDFLACSADVELSQLQDWEMVEAVFDMLISRALRDDGAHHGTEHRSPLTQRPRFGDSTVNEEAKAHADEPPEEEDTQHPLVGWLKRSRALMQRVHPAGIQIVELRVDGYQNREIAERLGLGLRLVNRIVDDMRTSWERATEEA